MCSQFRLIFLAACLIFGHWRLGKEKLRLNRKSLLPIPQNAKPPKKPNKQEKKRKKLCSNESTLPVLGWSSLKVIFSSLWNPPSVFWFFSLFRLPCEVSPFGPNFMKWFNLMRVNGTQTRATWTRRCPECLGEIRISWVMAGRRCQRWLPLIRPHRWLRLF